MDLYSTIKSLISKNSFFEKWNREILEPTDFDEKGVWYGPDFWDNVEEMKEDLDISKFDESKINRDTTEWKKFAMAWMKVHLEEIKNDLKNIDIVNNKLKLYRCIGINGPYKKFISEVENRNVGIYWSYEKNPGCVWFKEKGKEIILTALVDKKYINIEATAIQNLHPWSRSEKEIRLNENAEIEIISINTAKGKPIWSGKMKAYAYIRNRILVKALYQIMNAN